jgi:hypothetical protein
MRVNRIWSVDFSGMKKSFSSIHSAKQNNALFYYIAQFLASVRGRGQQRIGQMLG